MFHHALRSHLAGSRRWRHIKRRRSNAEQSRGQLSGDIGCALKPSSCRAAEAQTFQHGGGVLLQTLQQRDTRSVMCPTTDINIATDVHRGLRRNCVATHCTTRMKSNELAAAQQSFGQTGPQECDRAAPGWYGPTGRSRHGQAPEKRPEPLRFYNWTFQAHHNQVFADSWCIPAGSFLGGSESMKA